MKILPIIILLFIFFAGFKALLLLEEEDTELPNFVSPNFDTPFPVLGKVTGDGLERIGNAFTVFVTFIKDVVVWLFTLILNIFKLVILVIQVSIFLLALLFSPIDSAPFIINFVMIAFTVIGLLYIFREIRGSGSD